MPKRPVLAFLLLTAALDVFGGGAVLAQEAAMEGGAAKCAAMVAPPPALSGWSSTAALSAAGDSAGLTKAALTTGQAANVALLPTRTVKYVSQPEKPGGSAASGGLVSVTIAQSGTYQVTIDSGAWLDVLKDGAMQISTAHAPGVACTGMKKTVQFKLDPGQYVLQISANADPHIKVMVSKVS